LAKTLGLRRRGRAVAAGQHHQEFLATVAAGRIVAARGRLQACSRFAKHRVAGKVAVA